MVLNFKKILHIISVILIILFFNTCETEGIIDYDIFEYENKLVVQGFISNEQGVIVNVNKSLPPLTIYSDSIENKVKNVKVQLFTDNIPSFYLNEIEEGIFVSPDTFLAKYNKGYKIEITADDFTTVTSSVQYLPVPSEIDSVKYFKKDYFSYLSFSFCDNQLTKNNYYYEKYIYHSGGDDVENYFNPANEYFKLFDPGKVISDDLFNGSYHIIQDQIFVNYWNYNDTIMADSVKIFLYSLSDDIVKFLNSIDQWEYSDDDLWQEIPVMVYSNINGGYGLFASYSQKSAIIRIP